MRTISLSVIVLFVSSAFLSAQDIPLIDLTKKNQASNKKKAEYIASQKAYSQKKTVRQKAFKPAVVQKEQVLASSQSSNPKRLRLFLRELSIIQKAAKEAGGKVRIIIEPIGITPEDLVPHLANMNWFDIRSNDDTIVVRSKTEDPYMVRLREETNQLEKQRQNLLADIQTLQRMNKEWKDRSPGLQNSGRYPSEQQSISVAQSKTPASTVVSLSRGQAAYQAQQGTRIPMGQNQIVIPGQMTRAAAPVNVPATFSRPQPQAPASTTTTYAKPKRATGRLSPLAMQTINASQPDVSLRSSESIDSTVTLSPKVQW